MNGEYIPAFVSAGLFISMPMSWEHLDVEGCPVSHVAIDIKLMGILRM